MAGTYDVTVRMPVGFESAAEMAGWLERTVTNAMEKQGWIGGCVVIFLSDHGVVMFQDGKGVKESGFVLPHGLVNPGEG